MDINAASPELKTVGLPVVTTVEKKDADKPLVAPVAGGSDSEKVSLSNKELHGRKEDGKQKREKKELSFEVLTKEVSEIQQRLDIMGTSLGLHLRQESESIVAMIVNRKSGELIKQIPSEELLKIREKLDELTGLIFDKKI